MTVHLHEGDCLHVLRTLADNSIDSVVTDPPYGLSKEPDIVEVLRHWMAGDDYTHSNSGFMGKAWDSFVPGPAIWREVLRVLKPGGHILCFAGTRTQDLMGIALRIAGFEIRDCIRYEQDREAWPCWIYATGFPKSLDVSKALDKAAGASREVLGNNPNHRAVSGVGYEGVYAGGNTGAPSLTLPATDFAKQWKGWGTALKPAWEPVIVGRKPVEGTVAQNVAEHGTGALNIDACRVPGTPAPTRFDPAKHSHEGYRMSATGADCAERASSLGRWPANVVHDGSEEVEDAFATFGETRSGAMKHSVEAYEGENVTGFLRGQSGPQNQHGDSGSVSRFFYCAKASKSERDGSKHPTVKPAALMAYLCKLVTPPGGIVLDPFAGSGTTGQGALDGGFRSVLIEREAEYCEHIRYRFALFMAEPPATDAAP